MSRSFGRGLTTATILTRMPGGADRRFARLRQGVTIRSRVGAIPLLVVAALMATACQGNGTALSDPSRAASPSTISLATDPPSPSPRPTQTPLPTPLTLLRTPSPQERAIIDRANASVPVLNKHIDAVNKALKAGSRSKLKTAAQNLRKWTTAELAWMKAHPAPDCVREPEAKYREIVGAFHEVSQGFLGLLGERDREIFNLRAQMIQASWNIANGSLQILRSGELFSRVSC